jgi:uncharacterized protein (TIGR04255 family)
MLFSELTFEKVVLEVRYESAYVFWDNSGKTMRQITGKHPKLEMVNAQLSSVQSAWWDEGITFNFNNVKADLTQDYPTSLETFKAVSSSICDGLGEFLEVKSYTRVGIRYLYFCPFKSKEEARDFFLKLNLVSVPQDRLKLFGAVKIEEEMVMLRFEDEDRGFSVRLSNASREITFNISRPISANTEKFQKYVVMFDIDCYTKKKVEAAAFIPGDFVRITQRTVENNLLRLAGL